MSRKPEGFLSTAPAKRVHEEVLDRLASFAATPAGRAELKQLPFQADEDAAMRHMRVVLQHKAAMMALDRDHVRKLLRRIRAPVEPTPRFDPTRIVLCETDAIQERLMRLGLQKWAAVGGLDDLPQADDYELAILLYDDGIDTGHLENVVELPHTAPPEAIAPEATLAWLGANRDAIEAAGELARLLGRPTHAAALLEALAAAPNASAPPRQVRLVVEEVRKQVDQAVKARLATVTVTAQELLASMGRGIPPSIQKVMDEAIAEGRRAVQQQTGRAFQPFVAGSPIGIDDAEVARAERAAATAGKMQAYHDLVRLARQATQHRAAIEAELAHWQAFDVPFALGSFAAHFDLQACRFGPALAAQDSVHLDLADREGVQRIAYHVGRAENVALLTGANSGGKTTLLEHLAQLAIMARLGLPVVGRDVEVPWVDELHYVTARRSLDAGAFESFLRGFLPITLGSQRRLVLADEVESVTELEAAGRILGFFLDRIATSDSLAVVVSHMAPQILAHCHAPVRVDGIEATGLDADNRLVVDRMPRMGFLARSTPEFIVQRLAATAKGAERELYGELLGVFRADRPAASALLEVTQKSKRKKAASAPP